MEQLYRKNDLMNFQNFSINQNINYSNISERGINNKDRNNEANLKLVINNLLE